MVDAIVNNVIDEDVEKNARLCELFEADLKDQGIWRLNLAARDERYYHGEQRTKAEVDELEEKHRAPTIVNEIAPVLDRILGGALDLEFDWEIIPIPGVNGVQEEEERAAQVYTSLFDEAKDRSGVEFSLDDVKEDGLMIGRGWLEFVPEKQGGETIVKLLHVPWGDMWWDCYATEKYLLSDARHFERAKWVPLTVAMKTWPKAAAKLKEMYDEAKEPDALAGNNLFPATRDYELHSDALEKPTYVDKRNKRIRIVEMWYFDGEATDENPMGKVRLALFSKKALISDKPTPLKVNILPFVPYTVKVDHNGKPYGIIRTMVGLQDVINKRYSKAEFLLDVNQVIYTEGAVRDEDTLGEQVAQPDGQIALGPDAEIGKNFLIERGGEFSAQQYNIFSDAVNRIREVAGANREFMGGQTNARSGAAIEKRTAASGEILYRAYRNIKRTWDQAGRVMKEFIEAYYSEQKVVRITNDEGAATWIDLEKEGTRLDLRNAKSRYDLKHMAVPASKDARRRELAELSNVAKTLGPGTFPPEIWIENSGLRHKARYVKMLREREKRAAQPTPEQQAKVQKLMGEAQAAMAKGGLTKAQIQEVLARAGLEKAQTEGQQVETSLMIEKLEALEKGVASIKLWVEGQTAEGGEKEGKE